MLIPLGAGRASRYGPSEPDGGGNMADAIVPHFHNDPGVAVVHIGAREFKCVGARPPHDHPHVYLDMGEHDEIICPYCSTLYRHDNKLAAGAARPAECALAGKAA
jgi:uncharacterized Zn-finger protein